MLDGGDVRSYAIIPSFPLKVQGVRKKHLMNFSKILLKHSGARGNNRM